MSNFMFYIVQYILNLELVYRYCLQYVPHQNSVVNKKSTRLQQKQTARLYTNTNVRIFSDLNKKNVQKSKKLLAVYFICKASVEFYLFVFLQQTNCSLLVNIIAFFLQKIINNPHISCFKQNTGCYSSALGSISTRLNYLRITLLLLINN